MKAEPRTFDAGTVTLRSGSTLPEARLVYATHGSLNPARDNAILLPTPFGEKHGDVEYLIGSGRALDPDRYFIVVPNLFGNGVSTSPSTARTAIPDLTIHDNVTIQHRLVSEVLGIRAFELVVGYSMGGQQAYEWACRFPAMVRRLAVICAAARTTPHTWVFLEGLKSALCADPDALDGGPRGGQAGKRALARVWAGWASSQAWYREERYRREGYVSVADYLERLWDPMFEAADARDLVAMLRTWQAHDIGCDADGNGDFETAMRSITASSLIMPGSTDLYFPPEDSANEVELLSRARLAVIESVHGHGAGSGADPDDLRFIENEVRALLADQA